ncbi:putative two-component system response regulator [Firmicutes bacterium CAG:227]|nr:putative two-component system response regulator [Firmicutes bacterium CAG:227]
MKFDVLGLLAACSYALDCVEAELIKVTNNHSKRVAYMAVCTAEKMGIQGQSLQDLAECALLHDNAVAQYIQEELQNDALRNGVTKLGRHCTIGEKILKNIPFHNDVSNVILYLPMKTLMEVNLLENNGMKYRFLQGLSICVIR